MARLVEAPRGLSEVGAINCTGLPAISPEVTKYLRASLAENTRRAYRSDLNHFLQWGGAVPASPELIARYLANHAERHAPATRV